jgi:hypothetical protein
MRVFGRISIFRQPKKLRIAIITPVNSIPLSISASSRLKSIRDGKVKRRKVSTAFLKNWQQFGLKTMGTDWCSGFSRRCISDQVSSPSMSGSIPSASTLCASLHPTGGQK